MCLSKSWTQNEGQEDHDMGKWHSNRHGQWSKQGHVDTQDMGMSTGTSIKSSTMSERSSVGLAVAHVTGGRHDDGQEHAQVDGQHQE